MRDLSSFKVLPYVKEMELRLSGVLTKCSHTQILSLSIAVETPFPSTLRQASLLTVWSTPCSRDAETPSMLIEDTQNIDQTSELPKCCSNVHNAHNWKIRQRNRTHVGFFSKRNTSGINLHEKQFKRLLLSSIFNETHVF